MTQSGKVIYAQSSDIKSRTFSEYRRDMKKKAIAELEFLPFLKQVLANCRDVQLLDVRKHGGDAELWFSTDGRISQEPDYIAEWRDGKSFLYEFQYAEQTENLNYFDFKVSKVGKKNKKVRIPHQDREFFYVVKPDKKYAFISPEWIMENGDEGAVPAWGNRTAYRVPSQVFVSRLESGGRAIENIITAIDNKNRLLNFQHNFLSMEADLLSRRLQNVTDGKEILKIVPGSLQGFYESCYLLNRLGKFPDNPGVWLGYLSSFIDEIIDSITLAKFVFLLDFLYFCCVKMEENEKEIFIKSVVNIANIIKNYQSTDGLLSRDARTSTIEETRQILFAINLLEDLIQEVAVKYDTSMNKIDKIFQTVPDVNATAARIQEAERDQFILR